MSRFESPDFLRKAGEKYEQRPHPPPIDMSKPSIARVYSYFLGGKDHFPADREMANYAEGIVPGVTDLALGNRAFVQRSVRVLAESGIRQFLDIGSGLPTDGNVHEIAQEVSSDCRVVYVDIDPMVLAHARALLTENETTQVIVADLNRPQELLKEALNTGLLDLTAPVGLMLGGILHHLQDHDRPEDVARELTESLVPGSHLAISHFCRPDPTEEPRDHARAVQLEKAFLDKLGHGRWRTHEEILGYFCGWELLEPGLVPLDEWRPLPRTSALPGNYAMPPRNRQLIVGGAARRP